MQYSIFVYSMFSLGLSFFTCLLQRQWTHHGQKCVLVCAHAPYPYLHMCQFAPAVGIGGCFKVHERWWIGDVLGQGRVVRLIALIMETQLGVFIATVEVELWQHEWEMIYEIQYILLARLDMRQPELPHGRQCWAYRAEGNSTQTYIHKKHVQTHWGQTGGHNSTFLFLWFRQLHFFISW